SITMGKGQNLLSLGNGTVTGSLTITGGNSADSFVLGGDGSSNPKSFPAFSVNGNSYIDNGLDGSDSLTLNPAVTLKGNLDVLSANNFSMAQGASILGNARIYGGYASNGVVVAGKVGHELKVLAGNKSDQLSVTRTAVIDTLYVNLGEGKGQLNI